MLKQLTSYFRKLIDLREGAEEKDIIIENIKDDSDFSSARFWTLVFAIGVASVGLNINSIPIVIGAMLISPLMGPIVSIGLALAINDGGLMRRSLRNLFILTIISIGISSLYFALTPITNAQSELLSRTQPTIFDVLVAIFGGVAGFIGVSRAKHSNVIPGVAIATALMPPLCTVGYGIGTMQPNFIFGAFYLFLINSIFICLSALFVAKYLRLPKVKYENQKHQRRVRGIITLIIIVITTPALYLAFTFVEENNFNLAVEHYIETIFEDKGYVLVYKDVSYDASPHRIEVAFLSERFNDEQIQEFEDSLSDFGLSGVVLNIRQGDFALTEEDWQGILDEVKNDDEKVLTLEARLESQRLTFSSPTRLLEEAQAIDERIANIAIGSLAYANIIDEEAEGQESDIVLIYTASSSEVFAPKHANTITQWLSARLENSNLIMYFIPAPVSVIEGVVEEEG